VARRHRQRTGVSFLLYLVVFDLVDYAAAPRPAQRGWWWQLHAVHHSQRQMTMWSDNRNHLLDDLIATACSCCWRWPSAWRRGSSSPSWPVTQLVESLSHANVRLSSGPLGNRLLVSPRFHRLHHAIGLGHESAGPGSLGGHNFAVLFPLWDLLFGTARFARWQPTGIRDQLPEGRDYGRGFWAQQWLGLLRLIGRA
jgi:sterol desaturase/sphingolipid hydroxylase (fatty acid hydroxylase superfamily)